MPFRRKSRNTVSRPEKENAAVAEPCLLRCQSDNTQRSCSEINLNKSQAGALSAEAKMSNLMQLNKALVKEVTSLRISHTDACNKFALVESGLRAEICKLQSDISSSEAEIVLLKEEKTSLLVSQENLQSNLSASCAEVQNLSQELAMVKVELNQELLIEKTALAASEERFLSANCDIERLSFSNKTLNEEIITLKEEADMLASENEVMLGEKEEVSRGTAEKEAALAVLSERVCALEKLLDAEKKAVLDARGKVDILGKEARKLCSEKEEACKRIEAVSSERVCALEKLLDAEKKTVLDAMDKIDILDKEARKLCSEKEEVCKRIQFISQAFDDVTGRVISLGLQIEEEQAQHQIALKSVTEDFSRKLSEESTKVLAMEELLQQSNGKADTLSLQMQNERVKHEAELASLKEKLNECTHKAEAIEGLLQQRNSTVDALNQQLTDESAKHQLEKCALQAKVSAMAAEVSSSSAEYQKLFAKKENLHKELSRVNQKQRETNEQLSRERKSVAEAQKSLRDAERDVKQACLEREKTLEGLDILKVELSQFSNEKHTLLSDKQSLLEKNVVLEAQISSINSEKMTLAEQLQAAQKAHATDKQCFLAELKKMERAVSDLEVEQSDLLKQLNVEKMAVAAAQDSLASSEGAKQALLQEKFEMRSTFSEQLCAKEKALGAAEDHISSLHDEAQKLRLLNAKLVKQAASLKKQVTHIEVVKNGCSTELQTMLAKTKQMEAEMSDLSSSKQALQQKLEDDNNEATKRISTLKSEIDRLQQSKGSIVMDNKRISEKLALLKEDKLQFEACVAELNAKLEQSLKKVEAEKTSANILQAKLLSEMEQLRKENEKLTSANSDLVSSVKVSESQGKHLMSEKKKKDEQHVFLSKLYADLETSHSALQTELATHKAAGEALARDNAVLQSSIEAKARAIVMLEKQLDESTKNCSTLESQIDAISVLLKSSQEDLNAHLTILDAEKVSKASLCSSLEMKSAEIERLEEQLRDGEARIVMLNTQLATSMARQNEVESIVCSLKEELSMANKTATHVEVQAKTKLDGMMALKNDEISKLKIQLNEASMKKSELGCKLKACNEKKNQLESQVKKVEAELVAARAVALKAEKIEGEFNEASKRISSLEAQLTAKATMQNDLELQVISLKTDLHAARTASEKAEQEWKANMDTMLDNANARSRALEEQLESVKKTLCEMQNNANRGQESIASLQTQLSCLMEEKSSLEKKALSSNSRSMEQEETSAEEGRGNEAQKAKMGSEKSKLVRLALPVFLITTASSLVFAGIQNYIGRLEN